MKVGVIGSSGFLGTNVLKALEHRFDYVIPGGRKYGYYNKYYVDARNPLSLTNWIKRNGVTHVVNLAATCGGIGLNKKHPFELWLDTTRITAAVLEACVTHRIDRVVMVGTVCSYAANCPVPFVEDDLMNHGMPEPTNRAYGVAKLNGLIGAQAANKEHDLDVINLIPVNMYGPHDHFDLENSHVIPALINKLQSAIDNKDAEVKVWGTGKASREFLYVEDCAEAIAEALVCEPTSELMNVGVGSEITIRELVEKLASIMEYNGKFIWQSDRPDGQLRRCLDVEKITKHLGWSAKTNLDEGLAKTVEWYRSQEWS
jgi:nucleoside-diphosphate-sugar epimerase